MNFIHNELRNRLLEDKVDDLLMIYLNGQPWEKFDTKPLYNYLKNTLKFVF